MNVAKLIDEKCWQNDLSWLLSLNMIVLSNEEDLLLTWVTAPSKYKGQQVGKTI